ncbi:hypothetical protein E3U43_000651 [Larimichthys crocea]|uniref:Uncharacterized protein n=1 Tax=Larimichthys crocea TaxID=215358 RepID=A0ACD3Q9E9_LARCR|nr:hypothetical protein E3U43_000651 [Larimichthys crocea]
MVSNIYTESDTMVTAQLSSSGAYRVDGSIPKRPDESSSSRRHSAAAAGATWSYESAAVLGQPFPRWGRRPLLESVTFSTQPTEENGSGKIQTEIEAWRRRGTAHFPLLWCPISLLLAASSPSARPLSTQAASQRYTPTFAIGWRVL